MNTNTTPTPAVGDGLTESRESSESSLRLPDVSPAAVAAAGALLAHFAPLYPTVAAATRFQAGAQAWIRAWSLQIELACLLDFQIRRGLTRLARGEHDPDVPLSWSVFYRLCYDPWRDCNDPVDPAERERKLREFKEKYPGAKFVN